jgi:hypothetical protein
MDIDAPAYGPSGLAAPAEWRGPTGPGHRVRLVVFGSTLPQDGSRGYTAIAMGHVVAFLSAHLRDNRELVRHAQVSDPALGFLSLLEKAERGSGP